MFKYFGFVAAAAAYLVCIGCGQDNSSQHDVAAPVADIAPSAEDAPIASAEATPSEKASLPYKIIERHDHGSTTVQCEVVNYQTKTRTKLVMETRVKTEIRTRTMTGEDGQTREETYAVEVPYTVQVPVEEQFQVPVSVIRTITVPAGADIEAFLKAQSEKRSGS